MFKVTTTFWDGSTKSQDFSLKWVARDSYLCLCKVRAKYPDQIKEVSIYDLSTDSLESEGS